MPEERKHIGQQTQSTCFPGPISLLVEGKCPPRGLSDPCPDAGPQGDQEERTTRRRTVART